MTMVAVGAAVTTVLTGAGAASGAGGSGAAVTGKPDLTISAAPTDGDAVAAISLAYRTVYPQLSARQAEQLALQNDARRALYDKLTSPDSAGTFGGAWFDPVANTVHVNATTSSALSAAASSATSLGLKVRTHRVINSYAGLEAQAAALRSAKTQTGAAALGNVGIDVRHNTVVANVPAEILAQAQAAAGPGVTVAAQQPQNIEEDLGCTARNACDWTIRAGSMLWRTNVGNNVCSVGFTARNSANVRYVYTAGHCSSGAGVTWGTGTQAIGPMGGSINSGAVDGAVIRVTNPWFTGDAGGEIYQTLHVNGVAPTLSYLVAGETVCLSANYTNPTGPNYCGVIATTSDPAVRGMVKVNGLDACGGDSGGGWYWLSSSGSRIAYGIHSRSVTGCHVSGGTSWFSAVPTVKAALAPSLNIETSTVKP
jgi:streptogrisin C